MREKLPGTRYSRYHAKHREERNAQKRAWDAVHQAEVAAYRAGWLAAHRTDEAKAAWDEAHRQEKELRAAIRRDRAKEYNAVYKIAHRSSLQDYMRAWSAAHPESGRTTTRAYRARKTGVETEPYTLAEIYERDRGICQLCYKRVPTKTKGRSSQRASIDHIIPLSEGGNNLKANVQLAHDHCNQRKSNRDAVASQLRLVG